MITLVTLQGAQRVLNISCAHVMCHRWFAHLEMQRELGEPIWMTPKNQIQIQFIGVIKIKHLVSDPKECG